MTNPHLHDCSCRICSDSIERDDLRNLLRSCLRTHAPEGLRMKIVFEVRQIALTWEEVDEE